MLLPFLVASLLSLQSQTGTIHGIVRAEGSREPIPGAAVTIAELARTVHADAHGFFVIAAVPAGRWRVEASALGHSSHAITVVTSAAGAVRLDFELAVRPVPLPGVVVRTDIQNAERSEFIPSVDPGPAAVRMTAQAMKVVPGLAEPDVFRALQTLPSVTAISDYSSALYVRGGSADQNLITLDGMQLFNPYHVGGIFSAIPTDAVSAVDLYAGALPARTGDRVASAVNINTREGGRDRIRTSGGVGLISTNLTIDGPLNAGRGSYLVTGRRTYLNAITDIGYKLKLIDFTMPYGFSDAYAKATHAVGELGTISLSGYWNGEQVYTPDRMRNEFDGFGEFDWGSRMLALNYRQALPHSLLLQARVGYSDFRGDFDAYSIRLQGSITCDPFGCDDPPLATDTVPELVARSGTRDILGAADLTWYGRTHTLRGGVQLDAYHFEHVLTAHNVNDTIFLPTFDERHRVTTVAAHLEDDWQAGARLRLRAGARVLHAGSLGTAIMPRLGARWQMSDRLAFTAGAGRYAQTMRTMKDDESVVASLVAYDLLTAQPGEAGLVRGNDVVMGAEYVRPNTRVRVDGYWKTMDRLVLGHEPEDPLNTPPLIIDDYRVGSGSARGIELSARHVTGRFDVGASYALAWAERSTDTISFAPRYDRRHQLDMSAQYQWGERGLINMRFVAASGQPFTPAIDVTQKLFFDPITQQWTTAGNQIVLGEHNASRLKPYLRLDVAARRSYEKHWFGRTGVLTPYLQVINVLANRNALVAEPGPSYLAPRLNYWPQLPMLPTFGVEWRF